MPSFIDAANGLNADASYIQQVIDALKGTAGKGIPLSPTAINDAINFAVAVKNNDAGASKALVIYKADGTVLLQVDKNGVIASPDGTAGASQLVTVTGTQTLTNKTIGALVNGALSSASYVLPANVALNNIANYFDGPSIAIGGLGGTWFAAGSVTLQDTGAAATFNVKLWDGTTVIASGVIRLTAANTQGVVSLMGFIPSPVGNVRISVNDATNTTGLILVNQSGNGKDSSLVGFRIA